jgi:hypothetical protein
MVAMVALIALGSLAVDYARVQAVKTDLQKSADATARGSLSLYQTYDMATAQAYGPWLATGAYNPVESSAGVQPTVTITWGKWDDDAKAFTPGTFSPPAVRVTVSRTAANNNPVPLALAAVLGQRSLDVSATAVAVLSTSSGPATYTVSGQHDPWLAGMPAGSTASYNDVAPAQGPPVINLPPGASGFLTFTGVSGSVAHGGNAANGPEGNATGIYTHGADSPGGPTPGAENGIADIAAPINGLVGVFLDASQPSLSAAPAARDYSTSASRDAATYTDLLLKQPFYVGDGLTTSGTVQQFRIPPGATRLYLGPMDGHEWANNTGSFTVTLSQSQSVSLVK